MAEQRQPMAIEVNGAYLFVKDPNPPADDLFVNYQRVTGLSSFTLPAEVGGTNEIQLMDGTVQFASRKGVGTITGAIGSLTSQAASLFLEEASAAGDSVTVAIVRLAEHLFTGVVPGGTSLVAIGTTYRKITIPSTLVDQVKSTVLAGHLVAIGADRAVTAAATLPTDLAPYRMAKTALTTTSQDANWQSIVSVEDDGSSIIVSPGFSAVQAAASSPSVRDIFFRRPGALWEGILVKVNGFDSGDFQQGSAVAGNMTLAPSVPVPVKTPEIRTVLVQSATDGSYTV